MAEHVAVMYCGHIIEYADVHTLFENPLHPYTKGLYRSIPRLDVEVKRLDAISGMVPNLIDLSLGCPYQNRCEFCSDTCLRDMPALIPVADQHLVKCHLNRGS
jgi:peptide/nickel transport system ATP-binding protein/oligopeptide transport system ATP-binding protein